MVIETQISTDNVEEFFKFMCYTYMAREGVYEGAKVYNVLSIKVGGGV
jgi:hypothetical protein